MFRDFPVRLENTHVINSNQIFVSIVPKGPMGTPLNSSFANRSSDSYQTELGSCIANFCRTIPEGILVFFPSYGLMNSCLDAWKRRAPGTSSSIWDRIIAVKYPVIEPKDKAELPALMNDFYKKLNDTSHSGSIFFAVCRGKVSEGLDFSDAKGRAVIVTGIPYPAVKDPKVELKKSILDENFKVTKLLSGKEWYSQQALRAVNQAIGRVIRHRKDYGAILLCDERFASSIHQLSLWLRGYVKTNEHFGEVQSQLTQFFRNKKHEPQIEEIQPSRSTPATSRYIAPQGPIANNSVMSIKQSSISTFNCLDFDTNLIDFGKSLLSKPSSSSKPSILDIPESRPQQITNENKSSFPVFGDNSVEKSEDTKRKAQIYIREVKDILTKDQFTIFQDLLRSYRAGRLTLPELIPKLKELFGASRNPSFLRGFRNFLPEKHYRTFDELLADNTSDASKKQRLHEDFAGRNVIEVTPVVSRLVEAKEANEVLTATAVEVDSAKMSDRCMICTDKMENPCIGKCVHIFCFECWKNWLSKRLECPLCRERVRLKQLTPVVIKK